MCASINARAGRQVLVPGLPPGYEGRPVPGSSWTPPFAQALESIRCSIVYDQDRDANSAAAIRHRKSEHVPRARLTTSVIIPNYNHADVVARAIASVSAQ